MSTFNARFRSRCESCDGWINEGDTVRWAEDVVVHDACRESPDPLAVPRPPCGACFMVPATNGKCGCDE